MTVFDFLLLAVLGVSSLLGLLRGLVKEILSLIAYLLAFFSSVWLGGRVSVWLAAYLQNDLLRMGIAYGVVFICVLLLVGLLNITLATLIDRTGLTPADHGLGALFGLARGALIVLVVVTLAGYTELPKEPWWREAKLAPAAVQGVRQAKQLLPPSLAEWLPY